VATPEGGGGVGVCRWHDASDNVRGSSSVARLVFSAGSEGKLVFLDLSSVASGESAGLPGALRRLAAARSPAEEGTPSKPATIRGGEDERGEAPPADAAPSSPRELPPQGVRGGVGAPLPGRFGSISARVSMRKSLRLFDS